jgi:glycogen debranching enzyme
MNDLDTLNDKPEQINFDKKQSLLDQRTKLGLELSEALPKSVKPAWEAGPEDIHTSTIEKESIQPPSALEGIRLISERGDGVKASIEGSYDTVFGRDSAVIGLSLVEKQPKLAKNIIMSLATRQGISDDPKSEENPGKIHHEERTEGYGKSKVRNALGGILEKIWASEDSGSEERKFSYVSADSTPLFVKLVSGYCKYNGNDILDEEITLKNGECVTIGDNVEAAVSWIENKINSEGLVEVERRNKLQNPFGQTWKDSITGMIRPDGSLVNVRGRIIYPEIQTLSIDALEASASILQSSNSELARERTNKAHDLRIKVLESMWSNKDGFFISGLRTLESTSGRMLNSSLFDELNENEKKKYIGSIVERLFSDDFLTDAGIRSRALRYGNKLNAADYHGSYVSWPTDTFQIAEGLRKQGMPALAEQLENRLINAVNMSSRDYEFFFVNDEGRPMLDYKNKAKGQTGSVAITMAPEHNQGWTFSSVLDIKRHRGPRQGITETARPDTWQADIESQMLANIKNVQIHKNRKEMVDHYPTETIDTKLNKASGFARTAGYLASELAKQYGEHRRNK